LNIQIINPLTYPGYDNLLVEHDNYTFFHSSSWARVLHESYGYKPLYFTVIGKNELSALIPIMEIKSIITGKRGVSLPFTDECSPIGAESDHMKALIDAIIRYGKSTQWKHFELRGDHDYLAKKPHSSSFYAHNLDLTRGKDKIFSAFRASNRRNIKRALKGGIQVTRLNTWESVMSFRRLNRLTRKYHGLPPQPLKFFKNLRDHIISKNKGFFVIASYQGRNIAGALYLTIGKKAVFKYGASDRRFQHLRANNRVMWAAIKWCIEKGFETFCFGRTESENEGLLQFKRGWDTSEETLNYYKYDLKQDCFVSKESKLRTSYSTFKYMPSPLLRLTGSLLYRHVG